MSWLAWPHRFISIPRSLEHIIRPWTQECWVLASCIACLVLHDGLMNFLRSTNISIVRGIADYSLMYELRLYLFYTVSAEGIVLKVIHLQKIYLSPIQTWRRKLQLWCIKWIWIQERFRVLDWRYFGDQAPALYQRIAHVDRASNFEVVSE